MDSSLEALPILASIPTTLAILCRKIISRYDESQTDGLIKVSLLGMNDYKVRHADELC